MAIAVAAHAFKRQDANSTSFTVTDYNHVGGTQQALAIGIVARAGAVSETYTFTVTWSGTAVSQIQAPLGPTANASEQVIWLGILRGATTGTNTLSISISGGNVNGCAIKLLSLTGVKQTGNAWGSGANSPAISRESTTATSITDDLTTTTTNSLLIAMAGGIRGSGVTTFSGWSANWTAAGSTQYDDSTGLSAPEATAASAYRTVAASASVTSATATWAATCTRRSIAIAEILEEPSGGGGSGADSGVIGVGPINGQDSGQYVLLRRDAMGDQGGATNTYAIKCNFSDIVNRLEGPASIADSGDNHIIAIRRASGAKPELYLDGELKTPSFITATAPAGALSVPVGPLYIGAGSKDSATGGWNGILDEFRFATELIPAEHLAADAKMWIDRRKIYGIGARNAFATAKSPVAIPLFVNATTAVALPIDITSLIANPSGGVVTLDSVFGASSGAVITSEIENRTQAVYTSNVGFIGSDNFEYQVSQGGKISSGRVAVTVAAGGEEPPPPIEGNGNLQFGGLFIGHPNVFGSHHIGPVKIGKSNSFYLDRTFIDRLGVLKGFHMPIRVNRPGVSSDQPGEYSVGDGGEWIVEFWTSPIGSNPAVPQMAKKLGQTFVNGKSGGRNIVAAALDSGQFLWEFEDPINITQPGGYCLHFKRASSSSEYFAVNMVNGATTQMPFTSTTRDGPYQKNYSGHWERSSSSSNWQLIFGSNISVLAPKIIWEYTDGKLVGMTDTCGGAPQFFVGGSNQVKYRFKTNRTVTVSAVWLCAHRQQSTAADLTVKVLGKSVVYDMNAFDVGFPISFKTENRDTEWRWIRKALSSSVTTPAAWIDIILTAPSTSAVLCSTSADQFLGRLGGSGLNDATRHRDVLWDRTELYQSTNGGSTWGTKKNPEGDLVDNIHLALELVL